MFDTTLKINRWLQLSRFSIVSRFGSWLDHKLYLPYKGYNRWRSRQWNIEHTAGKM